MTRWIIQVDGKNSQRGTLIGPGIRFECALGKGGVIAASRKVESDAKTPLGVFPVRRIFYRPDRELPPTANLPVVSLSPDLGWCDDPEDRAYNRMVRLPFPASHENMWREDHLYDLGLIIGHNDDPVEPGKGSAIFIHAAKPGEKEGQRFKPTLGCAAFDIRELRLFLSQLVPDDFIAIVQDG